MLMAGTNQVCGASEEDAAPILSLTASEPRSRIDVHMGGEVTSTRPSIATTSASAPKTRCLVERGSIPSIIRSAGRSW